jgi:UDP-2,3-diacylglucosamine pyrophosphatase LpxH
LRTLVISDLHLGQGGGVSVLTRPRPLAALLDALDAHDRLVLLGDTVELQETHGSQSLATAELVLRRIGERLGEHKQVLLLPGNHDHWLVRDWSARMGTGLARENLVPPDASPQLRRLVSALSDTNVEIHYPGVWLDERTWATHGHYLNHYLHPVSSVGVHRPAPTASARPASFEYVASHRTGEPHLSEGLLPERAIDRHLPSWLAPLTSALLDRQMRRHALPAMLAVISALGVDADQVIFGHVHRRGPRARDDQRRWAGPGGRPRLLNTGSWRYEPVIVRRLDGRAPYWPGGAVSIGADGQAHSIGLLENLSERELVAVA